MSLFVVALFTWRVAPEIQYKGLLSFVILFSFDVFLLFVLRTHTTLGEWLRDQNTMEDTITILQKEGWMA